MLILAAASKIDLRTIFSFAVRPSNKIDTAFFSTA